MAAAIPSTIGIRHLTSRGCELAGFGPASPPRLLAGTAVLFFRFLPGMTSYRERRRPGVLTPHLRPLNAQPGVYEQDVKTREMCSVDGAAKSALVENVKNDVNSYERDLLGELTVLSS